MWILSYSEIASGIVVKNPITRVTSNRYLICYALAVAVAIGITAFVCGSQRNTFALHETYVIIFLAVTILMVMQVVFQVMAERTALSKPLLFSSRDCRSRRLNTSSIIFHTEQGMPPATPFRKTYKTYIPCLILILLLIHEIYSIVSINLHIYNKALWWSLWALPELLAVFLFTVPDLVPKRKILTPRAHGFLG